MARKKKLINNTNIPQYAIERFARCVFLCDLLFFRHNHSSVAPINIIF